MGRSALLTLLSLVVSLTWGSDIASNSSVSKSTGCGTDLPVGWLPGADSHPIILPDINRTYLIKIPSTYNKDTPAPVIFSFHGRGGTADNQEKVSNFSNYNWNDTAIVVYPQALTNVTTSISQWQGDPDARGIDDIGFVGEILDQIEYNFCIDKNREYSSGFSNGGGLTNLLACDPGASRRFAAFAIVSGALFSGQGPQGCNASAVQLNCNPGRTNVPVLEMHGAEDTVESYMGGPSNLRGVGCRPSIPHWASKWAARNGLSTNNKTTDMDEDSITQYAFATNQLVTTFHVDNMTHEWPGGPDAPINASQVILDWFSRWSLPHS